jgi:hypothetical protein
VSYFVVVGNCGDFSQPWCFSLLLGSCGVFNVRDIEGIVGDRLSKLRYINGERQQGFPPRICGG